MAELVFRPRLWSPSPKSVILKVWCPKRPHQHQLGTCNADSWSPGALNQTLSGWGPVICVWTSAPSESDVQLTLRTAVLNHSFNHYAILMVLITQVTFKSHIRLLDPNFNTPSLLGPPCSPLAESHWCNEPFLLLGVYLVPQGNWSRKGWEP